MRTQACLLSPDKSVWTGAKTALPIAGLALIALAILVWPHDRDEGQYVAAIALMRTGLPYRDFAYLQTPLQPLVLSPLALLPAGWLLVGVRSANGLFAAGAAWLLFHQLRGRVASRSAVIAIIGMLCTDAFLLAASNARNDALPMLLLTLAQGAMFSWVSDEDRAGRLAFAGLCFGLAVSAKISTALPAAGAGVFLVVQARRHGIKPIIAFTAGLAAGLLPCLVLATIAPDQFRFGVFDYSLDAPIQWWTSIGDARLLQPYIRMEKLLALSLQGVIGVGLLAAILDRRAGQERRLLDCLIVGAVIGSYLPEPAFGQYLVPMIPAVAARLAFAFDALPPSKFRVAAAIVAAFSLVGLAPTAGYALDAAKHGAYLANSVEEGEAIAQLARNRTLATLSPEDMVGDNVNLERGFVTGPFLFRTSGRLGQDAIRLGLSPDSQQIDGALDRQPPGVIIVGDESRRYLPLFPHGLDEPLREWAISHGYRAVLLPGGILTGYVRPLTAAAISTRSRSASS